jgi:hypothetical protein
MVVIIHFSAVQPVTVEAPIGCLMGVPIWQAPHSLEVEASTRLAGAIDPPVERSNSHGSRCPWEADALGQQGSY